LYLVSIVAVLVSNIGRPLTQSSATERAAPRNDVRE
jgi:hypothetical protein